MRRNLGALVVVVGFGILALGLTVHHAVLRAVGESLVVDEPVQPSDVIVIAVDAFDEGVDDAIRLARRGVAPRVAVFLVGRPTLRRSTFRPTRPGPTRRAMSALRAGGVPLVEQIPELVTGTTDSGPALLEWCHARGFHSAEIVTTRDHSRRVRRVLDRAQARWPGVAVHVHVAPSSEFRPDDWWANRDGLYRAIVEWPKLAVDVVGHPLS